MSHATLTMRLFGPLEAYIDGVAIPNLHLREGERLLAYLALRHGSIVPYRQLALLFWPSEARVNDTFESADYPSTRQAVYCLRRAFGDEAWRLASPAKGVICLDLTGADVDLLEFDKLVQMDDPDSWSRAAMLYRAPILDSWPEGWINPVRTQCQRSYERISEELRHQKPAAARPETASAGSSGGESKCAHLETVGGAVPLDSRFYIARQIDADFHEAVALHDSIVLIKGARQMGKTSLLARGLQRARLAGSYVMLTDFQSLPEDALASANSLYRALAQDIADVLDLETMPEQVWSDRRSPNRNLERYLSDVVLCSEDKSLVWGLDEADRLFPLAFGSEVFGLFRSWHNRRALDPTGPWARLTLVIAYATEVHMFISDVNQSPFNVGTKIELKEFSAGQIQDLNTRHGEPLRDESEVTRFMQLIGGHPYLVRRGLAEMVTRGLDIDTLCARADLEDGPFADHLRRINTILRNEPALSEAMRSIIHQEPCGSMDLFFALRSGGLISGAGIADARPRCNLYARYLKRHLA
jgi:hypothetical protein